MTIHHEGFKTITISTLLVVLVNWSMTSFFPEQDLARKAVIALSVLFLAIIVQFFRKPTRNTVAKPNQIIAPADGKVVVIEQTVENEYFKGPRQQISIFMSPLNVHINFNPIGGIVSFFKYHPGKKLFAWDPKSSTENERTTVVVKHNTGAEILYRQIAGALARRICWYIKEGQTVQQGQEFGFIKFGSRVDVFLPLDAKILVQLNDKPIGGETIIAELA
jgi:phosphatidylserine decarboxylase